MSSEQMSEYVWHVDYAVRDNRKASLSCPKHCFQPHVVLFT